MLKNPVLFKNFSDKDFTWKMGGKEHTFKAAEVIEMEDFEFAHFQKHLVDREMTNVGIRTNDQLERKGYEEKCVVNVEEPEVSKVEEAPVKVEKEEKEEKFEGLKNETLVEKKE